ncbi:MAG: hypothetical protein AABW50_01205 [Nanoarchaeota archaeon]
MAQTIGTKVEAPNQIIVKLNGMDYQFSRTIQGLSMPSGVNPEDYAMIHSIKIENGIAAYNSDSAISMTQRFNGLKYNSANIEALKSGLTVPTPAKFMPHLRNVNDALKGKGVLYDASGNLIDGERLKKYANALNYNHWMWLNAGFEEGKGFLGLDLVTINGLDDKENLIKSSSPLEDCLEENCWAELDSLNSQGFPTIKASIDKYEPGKTFYFWTPRKNLVARSGACSNRLSLSCSRDPSDRYPSLGVLPVFNSGSLARLTAE